MLDRSAETTTFLMVYGGFEQTRAKRRKLQVFLQLTAVSRSKPG